MNTGRPKPKLRHAAIALLKSGFASKSIIFLMPQFNHACLNRLRKQCGAPRGLPGRQPGMSLNPGRTQAVREFYSKGNRLVDTARHFKMTMQGISEILYPEKQRAHGIIARALKAGKIVRPTICSVCSKEKRIEAHHPDYSKPLEVIWTCKQCHELFHVSSKGHSKGCKIIRRKPSQLKSV